MLSEVSGQEFLPGFNLTVLLSLLVSKLDASQVHSLFHGFFESLIVIVLHGPVSFGPFLSLLLDLLIPLGMCIHVLLLQPLRHNFGASFDGVHLSFMTVFIDVEGVTSLKADLLEVLSIPGSVETCHVLTQSHLF